jgi:predicted SnoaL-like aldol condensation-catalyzing enzyme
MKTTSERNKRLVLDAFDTLFNKRDYGAAQKFWSPNYIQHSAHIPPGRDGLFNSGLLSVNWIAADILHINDGVLLDHWDVIQDEAIKEQLPMFGDKFPL